MSEESKDIEPRAKWLLFRYLIHELTAEEAQELEQYCLQQPYLRLVMQNLDDKKLVMEYLDHREEARAKQHLPKVLAAIRTPSTPALKRVRTISWPVRMAAAVILLMLVAIGIVVLKSRTSNTQQMKAPADERGSLVTANVNRATLTLSDGRNILLNNTSNGEIALDGGTIISKEDSGHIAYELKAGPAQRIPGKEAGISHNTVGYNILETRAGTHYSVTLPDGSRVWLNNLTSLRYPIAFTGNSRVVELNGEAYFEITRNKERPFFVRTAGKGKAEIKVLGTSFNVNAYQDEPDTRTTLFTGKVQVSAAGRRETLEPYEQLIVSENKTWQTLKNIHAGTAIAWKQGTFSFERDSLPRVLREIARQYDKDLVIEGPLQKHVYSAILPYSDPLLSLMKNLSDTSKRFHYMITDTRIIVSY